MRTDRRAACPPRASIFATGVKTERVTTEAGFFALSLLPTGQYTVTVTATGFQTLTQTRVVVDALDSIPSRLALADTCADLGVPLVHGAIGGWYGQVTTQFPGDETIQLLYGRWVEGKGIEQQLGNPSFTPALVASIQTAEVCKILLGVGSLLRNRKLSINLLEMEFEEVAFEPLAAAVGE